MDDIDTLRVSLSELLTERDALVAAHRAEMERVTNEARETVMLGALRAEALRLGAYDPEAVVALMDRSAVSWSEQGSPVGVDQAVAQERQKRAYLFQDPEKQSIKTVSHQQVSAPKPASAQVQDTRFLSAQEYALRKRQFLAG